MDDACAVRLVERVGDLDGDAEHLLERQRLPPQRLGERLPLEVLHHEELTSAAARRIGASPTS